MSEMRARWTGDVCAGDVFLLNHPWEGGVHLPDFFFARPVFVDDESEPIAFTVVVSHMVDVGGPFPGGVSVEAASLWEEGLVIPLVRLVAEGTPNDAVLDLIAANTRDPDKVLGDIRAALAGLETGARQVTDLVRRTGSERLRTLMDQLLSTTETATRAAIAMLPDGVGASVDHLDDDGRGGPPLEFRCEVTKSGDRLAFDFTGTADQVAAGINTTIADTLSVVAFATRATLGHDLPVNDGFTRCLEFHAPEGCIVNATPRAALGSRAASIYRLCDVAMGALAQLAPDRIPANDGGPGVVYLSGIGLDGAPFILLDYVQAGWGATAGGDGVPGASHPIANAATTPVEIAEEDAPIRIRRFSLTTDTAGVGTHVGAPGVIREYESLADAMTVNYRFDRCRHAPSGTAGGGAGAVAAVHVARADGPWEPVPGKGRLVLDVGDRLRVQLAAGGGFGPPENRRPEAVDADVADGYTTPSAASETYPTARAMTEG
jgi:N-methylhydantoinase B